ncbi:LuxR C-terminal-related transcriptional regulator [Brevundimonas sp.]|uniref:LuxR C-terminal-related transcriptional regulator n=1 Tax=Brevundimonas sp. TaxID=1871086 RepID=UPI002FC9A679
MSDKALPSARKGLHTTDRLVAAPVRPDLLQQRQGLRELATELSRHIRPDAYPEAGQLQTVLRFILPSPLPMVLIWGEEERLYFNAAFAALPGMGQVSFGAVLAKSSPLREWWRKSALGTRDIALSDKADDDGPYSHWSVHRWTLPDDVHPIEVLTLLPQTRRVLAEEALRASEETLATLMDQTPRLLWRCTPEGIPVWINKRARDYQGLASDANGGWSDILDTHDTARLAGAFADHQHDRRGFALHMPLKGAAAKALAHRLRFSPIFDAEGQISAWAGSGLEIDDWHSGWEAMRPPFDLVPGRHDVIWSMGVGERSIRPLDPQTRQEWGSVLEGQPVAWTEWCAVILPEERELALAIPDRVRAGEMVQVTLGLAVPSEQYQAVALYAFPIDPGAKDGGRIGGMFRPVRHRVEQRAYWVRIGGPDLHGFEEQRAALLQDQVRLLQFDEPATFVAVSRDLQPGAVIFQAPGEPQRLFDILEELNLSARDVPWLVTGMQAYPLEAIVRLMRMGAGDVLSASTGPRIVTEAIRSVVSRVRHKSPPVPEAVTDNAVQDRLSELSERERQVLDGLLAGGTNKSIALQLKLSPRTVEAHRSRLMDRLSAKSLADLLRVAGEAGQKR